MKTPNENLIANLEALLFLHGETGVKKEALIEVFKDTKPSAIDQALTWLDESYHQNPCSALTIQRYNKDFYRLCVKPTLIKQLEPLTLIPSEIHLSPTMIEVATIIAYKGPLTRGDLDQFRGIDSSFILNKLRELNLVNQQGYKPNTRAHLYMVTDEFFKVFNLSDGLNSLPPIKIEELEEIQAQAKHDDKSLFDQFIE